MNERVSAFLEGFFIGAFLMLMIVCYFAIAMERKKSVVGKGHIIPADEASNLK